MRVLSTGIMVSSILASHLLALPTAYSCNSNEVNSTLDDGNGSLRACIELANPNDTISFASDMHILLENSIQLSKDLTIDGGDHNVTIDGQDNVIIFGIVGSNPSDDFDVNISHVTLQHGYHVSGGGGAIFSYHYSNGNDEQLNITLDNTTLQNNTAKYGGAIALYGENINLTIVDSTISYNEANSSLPLPPPPATAAGLRQSATRSASSINGDGGAISLYTYGIESNSSITIINSSLSHNRAESDGGALSLNGSNINLTIVDSNLSYNDAFGANGSTPLAAQLRAPSSTVYGNGGAVSLYSYSYDTNESNNSITIVNSTLSHNRANGLGGALSTTSYYNSYLNNSQVRIENSTLSDNSAIVGGALSLGGLLSDISYLSVSTDDLTVTNSKLERNTAYLGGAVFGSQSLSISDSTITSNQAFLGSAVMQLNYAYILDDNNTKLTLQNSSIAENTASKYASLIAFNHNTTIIDSNITHNRSESMSGLILLSNDINLERSSVSMNDNNGSERITSQLGSKYIQNNANITITHSSFNDNNGTGLIIGALTDSSYGATVQLDQVTIDNNRGIDTGGLMIYGGDTLNVSISNSTISNNEVNQSIGGIRILESNVTVSNSTISGNSDDNVSGGIAVESGHLTLIHTTITDNHSTLGIGGVSLINDLNGTASNTIISANTGALNNDFDALTSNDYNLLGTPPTGWVQNTHDIISDTPLLGALADHGGVTRTHLPASNSPAVDNGNSTYIIDQRGAARPQPSDTNGGYVDIGSVEIDSVYSGYVGTPGDNGSMATGLHAYDENSIPIVSVVTTNPGTPPGEEPPAEAPKGTGTYPVEITATSNKPGFTQVITFDLPQGSNSVYVGFWKYGPMTQNDIDNSLKHWYDFGVYNGTTGYEILNGGQQMKVYIVDGMLGDDDLQANGIINDDGFPIVRAAVPVPLSNMAKLAMAFLMGLTGMFMFRRKKQKAANA